MKFNLPSASSFAPSVDLMFKCLLLISTILVVLVWGLMLYFCLKYRRGSKASREGGYRKNVWIEWSLAFAIFLFGLGTFIWSAKMFYHMYMPPASALEVDVIAKQWMWVFHDTRGKDSINFFKIPLGKPVRLVMTSEDVIHSLFIPAFRVKQDVLPGRYTSMWFTATELGSFDIVCSQYCGLSHSQMRAVVEVVTSEEYEKYLNESTNQALAGDPGAEPGADLYVKYSCHACHDVPKAVGPSLKGVFGRQISLDDGSSVFADENYLRRAILNPNMEVVEGFQPIMPTFQGRLSEADLMNIINYLKMKR